MFEMLDVLLGVTFIFLLLSLICSAATEAIEIIIKKRAKALQETIVGLLGDQGAKNLYSHALIQSLQKEGGRPPSYIPTHIFVIALLEGVLHRGARGTLEELERTIAALPPPAARLKQSLQALLAAADGNLARFQAGIEDWFNASMDRLSGWYKRRTQVIIFCLGLVFAAAFNIDTIQVVNQLSRDDALRAALVSAAENAQRTGVPPGSDAGSAEERFQTQMTVLGNLGLPLGWSPKPDPSNQGASNQGASPPKKAMLADIRQPPETFMGWVLKVLGLLLTGLAVSLGAPFWFDILNKIVVVRSTVSPGEKARKERPRREVPA
ncbi:hypothetical protein [Archangium violaceum]|uniref:Uncharacterized protein n=1 Tax=Archangium violaceum Cb vi76 TaxID=1406225 RepID=A0A084SLT7_9BACT|nr:hypothetical protein [Archangium violaceum]KFA89422.1 hypothetical protein Q664_34870 [Archangium violaceum Cb vi76]